jgi:lipopolysaccharide/colanic/teichoic acid biosynthesis glycosyltransferase
MNKIIIRILDIVFSIVILVVASPIIIFASLMVAFTMGTPIIFNQQRLGYKNENFKFYKFRSMINDPNLTDEQRITSFGKFIRKASIDELPQIYNVLKGDMSLAGPRPLLPEYRDHYTSEQIRRHDVRPGITGWAQVKGRNTLSWEEKFKLDVYYVDNYSVKLYLKILYKTIFIIIFSKGFSLSGEVKRFDEK